MILESEYIGMAKRYAWRPRWQRDLMLECIHELARNTWKFRADSIDYPNDWKGIDGIAMQLLPDCERRQERLISECRFRLRTEAQKRGREVPRFLPEIICCDASDTWYVDRRLTLLRRLHRKDRD